MSERVVAAVTKTVGTALAVIGVLLIGALITWNVFLQKPNFAACSWTGGCRSYLCVRHDVAGEKVRGVCSRACATDADCAPALACGATPPAVKDDLPPFGKPARLCVPGPRATE